MLRWNLKTKIILIFLYPHDTRRMAVRCGSQEIVGNEFKAWG